MGGFGAVNLALKHPDLFIFAAGISPALDVPSRPLSIKRIGQYSQHAAIFGPWKSEHRRANDPFVIGRSADPAKTPYLYLTCGDQEGSLPTNRQFAALLKARQIPSEFDHGPGTHDWNQWNRRLDDAFQPYSCTCNQNREGYPTDWFVYSRSDVIAFEGEIAPRKVDPGPQAPTTGTRSTRRGWSYRIRRFAPREIPLVCRRGKTSGSGPRRYSSRHPVAVT